MPRVWTSLIPFLVFALIDTVWAQSETNYALPSFATEVANVVNNTPGYMCVLTEGGTVPGESKSTCDGQTNGNFKSTTGFTLQHYYDIQGLEQMKTAYASMGGMKGVFRKSIEEEYNAIENDVNVMRLGFVGKGKLVIEQGQDDVTIYYTLTHSCVENANPIAVKTIYHVMLLTESDYLLITNEVYSGGPGMAKKYAAETLAKVKSLNYSLVK